MKKTLPALALTLLGALIASAGEYSEGNPYLATVTGGAAFPVGDYNDLADPRFAIPATLSGPITSHLGWTATYAFNRLEPSDLEREECEDEGTSCKEFNVNHWSVGPQVSARAGKGRVYGSFQIGADNVGAYEEGGDSKTWLAAGFGAGVSFPVGSRGWAVVGQLYADSFRVKEEDSGERRWSWYLTPSAGIGYSWGAKK
jgi:hypothetical protein